MGELIITWVEYKDQKVWQLECGDTVFAQIERDGIYFLCINNMTKGTFEADSLEDAKGETEKIVRYLLSTLDVKDGGK